MPPWSAWRRCSRSGCRTGPRQPAVGCPSGAPVITGAMARRPCLPHWRRPAPGRPPRPGSQGTGSSCGFSTRPSRHTGAWNCMSWWTAIAWPGTPRCAAGWPGRRTAGSRCTSPLPGARGWPWWRSSSGSSPSRGFGAAPPAPVRSQRRYQRVHSGVQQLQQPPSGIYLDQELHAVAQLIPGIIETVKQLMPQAADQRSRRVSGVLTRGITLSVDTFERSMVLSGQARPKCALACPAPPKHQG